MSWDLLVYRLVGPLPEDPAAAGLLEKDGRKLPPGVRCVRLGSDLEEVRQAVYRWFPRAVWERANSGMVVFGDLSMSIYYDHDAKLPYMAIQIHSGEAQPTLGLMALEMHWTIIDTAKNAYVTLPPELLEQRRGTGALAAVTGALPRLGTATLPPLPQDEGIPRGPDRELKVAGAALVAYLAAVGVLRGVLYLEIVTALLAGLVAAAIAGFVVARLVYAREPGP